MRPCILLGRFMPPHKGHMALVEQIKTLGYTPVLFIGEALEKSEKNPYDYDTRHFLWHLIYSDISTYRLMDSLSWDDWMLNVLKGLSLVQSVFKEHPVIAIHNKEEDRQDFMYKDVKYINEFYSKCFDVEGIETIQLQPTNISVRATQIRSNPEAFSDYLHPEVYTFLHTQKEQHDNKKRKSILRKSRYSC